MFLLQLQNPRRTVGRRAVEPPTTGETASFGKGPSRNFITKKILTRGVNCRLNHVKILAFARINVDFY